MVHCSATPGYRFFFFFSPPFRWGDMGSSDRSNPMEHAMHVPTALHVPAYFHVGVKSNQPRHNHDRLAPQKTRPVNGSLSAPKNRCRFIPLTVLRGLKRMNASSKSTSRKRPPFCINPLSPHDELLDHCAFPRPLNTPRLTDSDWHSQHDDRKIRAIFHSRSCFLVCAAVPCFLSWCGNGKRSDPASSKVYADPPASTTSASR